MKLKESKAEDTAKKTGELQDDFNNLLVVVGIDKGYLKQKSFLSSLTTTSLKLINLQVATGLLTSALRNINTLGENAPQVVMESELMALGTSIRDKLEEQCKQLLQVEPTDSLGETRRQQASLLKALLLQFDTWKSIATLGDFFRGFPSGEGMSLTGAGGTEKKKNLKDEEDEEDEEEEESVEGEEAWDYLIGQAKQSKFISVDQITTAACPYIQSFMKRDELGEVADAFDTLWKLLPQWVESPRLRKLGESYCQARRDSIATAQKEGYKRGEEINQEGLQWYQNKMKASFPEKKEEKEEKRGLDPKNSSGFSTSPGFFSSSSSLMTPDQIHQKALSEVKKGVIYLLNNLCVYPFGRGNEKGDKMILLKNVTPAAAFAAIQIGGMQACPGFTAQLEMLARHKNQLTPPYKKLLEEFISLYGGVENVAVIVKQSTGYRECLLGRLDTVRTVEELKRWNKELVAILLGAQQEGTRHFFDAHGTILGLVGRKSLEERYKVQVKRLTEAQKAIIPKAAATPTPMLVATGEPPPSSAEPALSSTSLGR